MHKTEERKRVNFMINKWILSRMNELIPARKMSDFVNEVLEEAIENFARRKAAEGIAELRVKNRIRMTTQEMIKLKNYGRE